MNVQFWPTDKWKLVQLVRGNLGVAYGDNRKEPRMWLVRTVMPGVARHAYDFWFYKQDLLVLGLLSSGRLQGTLAKGSKVVEFNTCREFTTSGPLTVRLTGPGRDMITALELGNPPASFIIVGVAIKFRDEFQLPAASADIGWQVRLDRIHFAPVETEQRELPPNVIPLFK